MHNLIPENMYKKLGTSIHEGMNAIYDLRIDVGCLSHFDIYIYIYIYIDAKKKSIFKKIELI